jgi:hypothetical protein
MRSGFFHKPLCFMVLFRAKVNRLRYSLATVFKISWMACAGVETPANQPIPYNAELVPGCPVPCSSAFGEGETAIDFVPIDNVPPGS